MMNDDYIKEQQKKKLSDKMIKNLKPAYKLYTITDGQGLSLEVPTKGSKRWRFRYRFNGKPKNKSFGIYPDVSLADAREKRNEARASIDKQTT